MSKPMIVEGRVSQVGFYSDCVPTLIILIKKELLVSVDFPLNERITVTFEANRRRFSAGIRTTEKIMITNYVQIFLMKLVECSDSSLI